MNTLKDLLTDDNYAFIYESGFSLPITKVGIQDISTIVRAVTLHSTVMPIKSELDQLAQGLEVCGILALIKKYPKTMKKLFLYDVDDKVSVETMVAMFNVEYSEKGSSRREVEEQAVQFWNEFLIDIGSGAISKFI